MREPITQCDGARAGVRSPGNIRATALVRGHWAVRAYDRDGALIWKDTIEDNLVVDEGLDHLLVSTLAGGTQITTWYVGLTDGAPTAAAGDTMSSHAGWTEEQGYDEAARQTWTPGAVSGQSVDNSGSIAQFTISSDSTTVGGAFLVSDNTKGGTTGTLYSIGAFSGGDVTLSSGSKLDVTATFTTSAV